ncbi:hypothetical protein GTP91_08385 [Rugamonas sp. FT82W]|uniref:Uncharacterized protein n=1 Tax=Duganella vulcania TaxID=2692166 RepID=A0A845G0T1_9BURK|nr:hypothetical protein [Duganella vulcania]MYM87200.1 hypothetical protein [Duganella vulcania]
MTLFLASTFVKGFPGACAPASRHAYLCTKKYFSSALESCRRWIPGRRNYLILLGKNYACGLGILLKPAPLKAFSAVKWGLFTTLSTVGVDICEKRFKYGGLSAFPQESRQARHLAVMNNSQWQEI